MMRRTCGVAMALRLPCRVTAIRELLEMRFILKVNKERTRLERPRGEHYLREIFKPQRAVFFQKMSKHFPRGAGNDAELLKAVGAAADQQEPAILNEFV